MLMLGLKINDYFKYFEREKKFLKYSHLIAGHLKEFKDKSIIKTDGIDGASFVTTVKDGVFNSFINSCAHRGMRLKTERVSEEALICPYHKWSYSSDGKLKSVTDKCFDGIKNKISLDKKTTGISGNIVLIKNHENLDFPPIISGEEFFSYKSRIVKANWKLIIDNAIETYHTPFIHKDSLNKVHMDEKKTEIEQDFCKISMKIRNDKNREKYLDTFFVSDKIGIYEHYFYLPNILFSHMDGIFFNLTQVLPIDEYTSEVRTWFSHAKEKKPGIAKDFISSSNAFTDFVFHEDDKAVEENNLGIIASNQQKNEHSMVLCDAENRIEFFHRHILAWFSEGQY